MSLRIIAGEFGGRIIITPHTNQTHPMGDRIRGSLFNILGDLSGISVLDAFAGSGSLGLEALSHGAIRATFIERDRVAQKVIQENILALGVKNQTKLIRASISQWDETSNDMFDLIFADPPYHDVQQATVQRLCDHLANSARLILSWPSKLPVPLLNGVIQFDVRSYGDATLIFYHKA